MAGVIITGLATELIFGDAADGGGTRFIEAARLGLGHWKTGTMAVGEKRIRLLGLHLVLVVHVRENPDRRLGKLLAANSEEADDEQRDERVGEKKVTHFELKFEI